MVTFVLQFSADKHDYGYMWKKIKELYKEYKEYVRVDLIMYASLILMIFIYFIITVLVK